MLLLNLFLNINIFAAVLYSIWKNQIQIFLQSKYISKYVKLYKC